MIPAKILALFFLITDCLLQIESFPSAIPYIA